MIRYFKYLLISGFIFIIEPICAQTNIFDCENSLNFSVYLFNTQQYELAQHELERITFFCSYDSTIQLMLLKTFRMQQQFQKANIFFNSKSNVELIQLNSEFQKEYIRLLMAQQFYSKVKEQIIAGINQNEKIEYRLGAELLLQNWEEAYQISKQYNYNGSFKLTGLKSIAENSIQAKRKKAWLSTIMSIIVPGSGKMYCNYWGDGITSLLFTASSGIFAFRAFHKYGTHKLYPWFIGGLAVSYYAANIYGGNRAAIHYNDHLDQQFIHDTEEILTADY